MKNVEIQFRNCIILFFQFRVNQAKRWLFRKLQIWLLSLSSISFVAAAEPKAERRKRHARRWSLGFSRLCLSRSSKVSYKGRARLKKAEITPDNVQSSYIYTCFCERARSVKFRSRSHRINLLLFSCMGVNESWKRNLLQLVRILD